MGGRARVGVVLGDEMTFETSMIYTMGTALNRAHEDGNEVAVLVDGVWLSGVVVISDGVGVVLEGEGEHAIVRVDHVTAVRVMSPLPWKRPPTEPAAAPSWDEPMPMPGPRAPS